ncbi:Ribosomal protein L11 methyltransferase [Candidatus Kinetoplastibacterium sorsogonicusi]|uniref:Ribosomal protein L11 methyltransferase n=1 Tax=Candidatus Kinetoplastidibacterium kentomonadis TaxID=1576550 RepID=A0A3Q8EYD9_9PROT|nr:50S ribosomal protein L11 methyltransferase [Candidatus Kinetoplastibacterium sorsogonicusi]AWD32696.1 Ribosomal protein L11 methyltransferase [Candidatus Kinetoplastibacterium sorsogonicusi]
MYELIIYCKFLNADIFSDTLLDYSSNVLSVSIENANLEDSKNSIFGEPSNSALLDLINWKNIIFYISVNDEIDPYDLIKYATDKTNLNTNIIEKFFLKKIDQNIDWVLKYQSNNHPININNKLLIISSWHNKKELLKNIKEIINNNIIELDPGLAFGTGSHPTTYLCLSWIIDNEIKDKNILDYGCGSGILAIAAKKFGAKNVTALDIDKQAIEATNNNALKNNVDISVVENYQKINIKYDIIISNILSNPLKDLSIILDSLLKYQGTLLLSGILSNQKEEILKVYSKWIDLSVWNTLDGWVCLYGKKY